MPTVPITKSEKGLAYVGGTLCIIQSVVSFIWYLICAIYFFKDEDVDTRLPISTTSAIYLRFLDMFYSDNFSTHGDALIAPYAYASFSILYVVFDVMWFLTSVRFIYRMVKKSDKLSSSSVSFFYITLIISILDVILVVGVGIDYGKICSDDLSELETELCDKAVIPVLIISARGFGLWFVNVGVAFACLLKNFGEPPKEPTTESAVSAVYSGDDVGTSLDFDASNSFRDIQVPRLVYEYRYDYRPTYNGEYRYDLGLDLVWKY